VIVAASHWFLAGVVMAILFVAWIVALFALVLDAISFVAKCVWFVALTLLAPIAIPVYLVLRVRRSRDQPQATAARSS
jgi:hypothetical protein